MDTLSTIERHIRGFRDDPDPAARAKHIREALSLIPPLKCSMSNVFAGAVTTVEDPDLRDLCPLCLRQEDGQHLEDCFLHQQLRELRAALRMVRGDLLATQVLRDRAIRDREHLSHHLQLASGHLNDARETALRLIDRENAIWHHALICGVARGAGDQDIQEAMARFAPKTSDPYAWGEMLNVLVYGVVQGAGIEKEALLLDLERTFRENVVGCGDALPEEVVWSFYAALRQHGASIPDPNWEQFGDDPSQEKGPVVNE